MLRKSLQHYRIEICGAGLFFLISWAVFELAQFKVFYSYTESSSIGRILAFLPDGRFFIQLAHEQYNHLSQFRFDAYFNILLKKQENPGQIYAFFWFLFPQSFLCYAIPHTLFFCLLVNRLKSLASTLSLNQYPLLLILCLPSLLFHLCLPSKEIFVLLSQILILQALLYKTEKGSLSNPLLIQLTFGFLLCFWFRKELLIIDLLCFLTVYLILSNWSSKAKTITIAMGILLSLIFISLPSSREKIHHARWVFTSSHTQSTSSYQDQQRYHTLSITENLYHGLQGIISPLPRQWLNEGRRTGQSGKLLAGLETLVFLGILFFLLYRIFTGNHSNTLFLLLIYSMAWCVFLGVLLPHSGMIYRLRFPAWVALYLALFYSFKKPLNNIP